MLKVPKKTFASLKLPQVCTRCLEDATPTRLVREQRYATARNLLTALAFLLALAGIVNLGRSDAHVILKILGSLASLGGYLLILYLVGFLWSDLAHRGLIWTLHIPTCAKHERLYRYADTLEVMGGITFIAALGVLFLVPDIRGSGWEGVVGLCIGGGVLLPMATENLLSPVTAFKRSFIGKNVTITFRNSEYENRVRRENEHELGA